MDHYYSPAPQADHDPKDLSVSFRGQPFTFTTDRSVFSRHQVDTGSRCLIETVLDQQTPPQGRLLDLGCGYGVLGIVFQKNHPGWSVVLSDINQRALALAQKNARQNGVPAVQVLCSDGLALVPGRFDRIISNPPVRTGKQTLYRLFEEAAQALTPGGELYLVLRKQQGARSAVQKLNTLFPDTALIRRCSGYQIIRARSAG